MSLFQNIHFIEHNSGRHDVYTYIFTKSTRKRKEKNRTKETSPLCLAFMFDISQ